MKIKNYIDKIIKEEVAKVRLKESRLKEDRFVDGTHPTRKAYWTYLESLPKEQLMRIAKSKQRIDSIDKTVPKQDLISHIMTAEFGKDNTKEIRLPEYAKKFLPKFLPKNEIKESSSQEDIESLAVDLIDYMGKELPPRPNPRIMRWFQESGLTDANIMKQIYQTALKLNRE